MLGAELEEAMEGGQATFSTAAQGGTDEDWESSHELSSIYFKSHLDKIVVPGVCPKPREEGQTDDENQALKSQRLLVCRTCQLHANIHKTLHDSWRTHAKIARHPRDI